MNNLFDGYLVVDWSANSRPKTGKDSIWWCHLPCSKQRYAKVEIRNPSTRLEAFHQIRSILYNYKNSRRRILLGMDFSYGYPQGFADRLVPGEAPPWKAVWRYFHKHITDNAANKNNRFEVATALNRRLTSDKAPFWGCPVSRQSSYLSMHRPEEVLRRDFKEFRMAEQKCSAQPVWKLLYAGSVGSQVLTGLPYLYQLITDKALSEVSRVWPFDTGLRALDSEILQDVMVLHAEVYPSLIEVKASSGEIKDRLQVQALAHHFAMLDETGGLHELFAGLQTLTHTERGIVEQEEGWILGM